MDRLPKFGFASLFDFVRPHIQADANGLARLSGSQPPHLFSRPGCVVCHPVFPRGVLVWWGGSAPTTGDRFRQYRRRIGGADTGTEGVG